MTTARWPSSINLYCWIRKLVGNLSHLCTRELVNRGWSIWIRPWHLLDCLLTDGVGDRRRFCNVSSRLFNMLWHGRATLGSAVGYGDFHYFRHYLVVQLICRRVARLAEKYTTTIGACKLACLPIELLVLLCSKPWQMLGSAAADQDRHDLRHGFRLSGEEILCSLVRLLVSHCDQADG